MLDEIVKEAERKMNSAVEHARVDFTTVRTGRAHPDMFTKLLADYYGTPTPLQQLASFQSPEPRTMLITPYDRGSLPAVERAIRDSDLGVAPSNDGNTIRIVMPDLTEERRKEYTKVVRAKAEDARVSVRNVRHHARDLMKRQDKEEHFDEDEMKGVEKKLDAMAKKHIESIDALLKAKEAELMAV
jgi:ribosome recycling factor